MYRYVGYTHLYMYHKRNIKFLYDSYMFELYKREGVWSVYWWKESVWLRRAPEKAAGSQEKSTKAEKKDD